jgi:hydrogenase maturation protease
MEVLKVAPLKHREGPCGKKFALISIGSMLNGDDGAPRIAAAMLPMDIRESVCLISFDVFTYFLSDSVGTHEGVIIIDTASTDQPPGSTATIDLLPVLTDGAKKPDSCHAFSMLNELKLAKRMGELPKTLLLFTIELGNTKWGNKISPELIKCMPGVVNELESVIRANAPLSRPNLVRVQSSLRQA